jgi:excisionase family DNA binding protein
MMKKDFLTTTEVAKILSVTPDAVLKWAKSRKILAYRTPGGHYRIPKEALGAFISEKKFSELAESKELYEYCWEFHNRSNQAKQNCQKCVVLRSATKRCWELASFSTAIGHLRRYCLDSCETCEYRLAMSESREHSSQSAT